jgi:hypothetical protein
MSFQPLKKFRILIEWPTGGGGLKVYILYEAGKSGRVLEEYKGESMMRKGRMVEIHNDSSVVIAINLKPGQVIEQVGEDEAQQHLVDRRGPGACWRALKAGMP